jgi:hypothetical protein
MEWIDESPSRDTHHDTRWNQISRLTFSRDDLTSATRHALDLYMECLAEDLRALWRFLRSRELGEQALDAMRHAGDSLKSVAQDRHRAGDNALAIIARLCKARWRLRADADRLESAAAARR